MPVPSTSAIINGKVLPAGTIYSIASAATSTSVANGVPNSSGSVAGFFATSIAGTVTVTNGSTGTFTIGTTAYQILGTTADGNNLVFSSGNGSYSASFLLANSGTAPAGSVTFATSNTYNNFTPACFVAGTRIATPSGEQSVETLRIGDMVSTPSGPATIKWVGHRTIDLTSHAWAEQARPVRIVADAFGPGLPAHDLLLSAGHAVVVECVDKVMVPIGRLVNGSTIRWEDAASVDYWHVELEHHGVLYANGLATESYLDVGNRDLFDHDLGLVPRAANAAYCLPFYDGGRIVDAVKERLIARAGGMGWVLEPLGSRLAVSVDGQTRALLHRGDTLFVALSAEAAEVRVTSTSWMPAHCDPASSDSRSLGIRLLAACVSSGTDIRELDLARLEGSGLHPAEDDRGSITRWTTGDAVLKADAWSGLEGALLLQLRIEVPPYAEWRRPPSAQPLAA